MHGPNDPGDTVLAVKPKVTTKEMAPRREHVRAADAADRIAGIFRDSDSDAVSNADVRGEIEAADIMPASRRSPTFDSACSAAARGSRSPLRGGRGAPANAKSQALKHQRRTEYEKVSKGGDVHAAGRCCMQSLHPWRQ